MELFNTAASLLIGGLISWGLSHWYYRRADRDTPTWAKQTPDWAAPLLAKLPDAPVSIERLVELYQEALEAGDITLDPGSGYIVCPECGAPSSEFESWEAADHFRGDLYHGRRCGRCKHELTWAQD